jgi:hypothetical protein
MNVMNVREMGGKIKKGMSIMLVAVLVLAFSPMSAYAADEYTSGDYIYTLSDGKATITSYTGSNTNVTIPGSLDRHPVTALGNKRNL